MLAMPMSGKQRSGFTSKQLRFVQKAALRDILKESEGGLRAMIVDLRDNPGGLLSSAVEAKDCFSPHGLAR